MFDQIRADYQTQAAVDESGDVGAAALRFGVWAAYFRFAPLRWLCGKLYGAGQIVLPILTGGMIDRRMVVGRRFHIIHPGMVLLHPQATFGDDCGVMHNVTVGTNMTGGAPTIGNDVFIGCGAVILGDITIGDGVRIAAPTPPPACSISDVPSGAMARGVAGQGLPRPRTWSCGRRSATGDARGWSPPARRALRRRLLRSTSPIFSQLEHFDRGAFAAEVARPRAAALSPYRSSVDRQRLQPAKEQARLSPRRTRRCRAVACFAERFPTPPPLQAGRAQRPAVLYAMPETQMLVRGAPTRRIDRGPEDAGITIRSGSIANTSGSRVSSRRRSLPARAWFDNELQRADAAQASSIALARSAGSRRRA